MACTQAQSAVQKGLISSAPEDQENRPQSITKHGSTDQTTSLQQQLPLEPTECDRSSPTSPRQALSLQDYATPDKRGTKRPSDALDRSPNHLRKRPRPSLNLPPVKDTSVTPASNIKATSEPTKPIEYWAREGQWPQEYFEPDMEQKFFSLPRRRSASLTSTTSSDQKPREEKCAPYRDARYVTLLRTKGSFMHQSDLGITSASKVLSSMLLETKQEVPKDSLFSHDVFESTFQKIKATNESRIIQDISRLIVPSAETLAIFGAKHLNILTEGVNAGWKNSVPLIGPRPQPDYSVGFTREAFTDNQLAKLSPFLGDYIAGDRSFFMGTYLMHFPFLTCEVKCANSLLDVADRQNAHSMTLAVRGVAELFRLVGREEEINQQMLAFSVSHNHEEVRIFGHYPVAVQGKEFQIYRHPIHRFFLTAQDGKEKWTAYYFTKNVYDIWMPQHYERICSAIDQLPAKLDFNVPSLTELSSA